MKVDFLNLDLMHKAIRTELDMAIKRVIDNSDFIKSKQVEEFEGQFGHYLGNDHVISCANGTDALEIALQALGVGEGDEVIVPAMSWISTSEVVVNVGAEPVFIDVDESFCIDPNFIEERITERTKAIIPVHLYGRPADMIRIMRIAEKHNLKVIEDCAQAHGAILSGKMVGNFGDAGTFSFFPTKNLGAFGDAGGIVFENEDAKEKAKLLANHGQKKRHNHVINGRNSRMDGIQAAVLSVKLKKLEEWNEQRVKLAQFYHSELKNISKLKLPNTPINIKHVFHLYVIRTDERDELKSFLAEKSIKTLIHYPTSLPFQECYSDRGYSHTDYPKAYNFQNTVLSLPFYPGMSKEEIKYVCDQIKIFYEKI